MRLFTLALLGFAAVCTSGCGSARYVTRNSDTGIVAVPSSTNDWPSYHRNKAIDLITRHVGPDYEIVKEEETVTGQVTDNHQQVNQVPTEHPVVPFLTTTQTVVTNSQSTRDVKEWFIHYRKRSAGVAHMTPGEQNFSQTLDPKPPVVQTGAVAK